MTDLQMTLFAAGGFFIVGVFSYNKWQEYKAKKSVERAFSNEHDDVLMRAGAPAAPEPRHEPSLQTADPRAPAARTAPAAMSARTATARCRPRPWRAPMARWRRPNWPPAWSIP